MASMAPKLGKTPAERYHGPGSDAVDQRTNVITDHRSNVKALVCAPPYAVSSADICSALLWLFW
jgi:hypothetical protein